MMAGQKAVSAVCLLLATLSFTPTPSSGYHVYQDPYAAQDIPTTPSPEQIAEAMQEYTEQQQETVDQYLDGLLDRLAVGSMTSGTLQVPTQEQQQQVEQQIEQLEQQIEQYQETVEQVQEQLQEQVEQVQENAQNQYEQAQETTEQVQEQVHNQWEQAQEATEQVQEQVQNQWEQAQEATEQVQEQVQETYEQAQEQVQETGEYVQEIVEAIIDAVYGPDDDDDDDNDNTTTTVAPSSTTTFPTPVPIENDDNDDDDDETTTATYTYPQQTTNSDDDADDTDDVTTILYTTIAPMTTTDDSAEVDDETTTTATYYHYTTTDGDDSQEDDDDVTTTMAPLTTTRVPVTRTLVPDHSTTTTTAAPHPSFDVPNLCEGCDFTHGVGYNPHPSDCTLFVTCRMNASGAIVVAGVQSCPHGLYWNAEKLTCDHASEVHCVDDICKGRMQTKKSQASCRGYWSCTSGTSKPKCCSLGYTFNPVTHRCHYDPTCQDPCLDDQPVQQTFECPNGLRSVPGDETVYEQNVHGNWIRMPCPATLAFSAGPPCGCNVLRTAQALPHKPVCKPELYLPFSDKDKKMVRDHSGRSLWIQNDGVIVKDGKAFFNGDSRLLVNYFSNGWWGSTLYISLRYKSLDLQSRQTLFANGDCEVDASMGACATPDGVEFYGQTQLRRSPANFTVPLGDSDGYGWQEVLYRLDEGRLSGYVNEQSDSEMAKGDLLSTPRGLVIGGGGNCEKFFGYIDEVIVFRCRPDYKK